LALYRLKLRKQIVNGQVLRLRRGVRPKTTVRPVDDLALVGEQNAGNRHDEDDQPGDTAGG
jgi:hypothetical protein